MSESLETVTIAVGEDEQQCAFVATDGGDYECVQCGKRWPRPLKRRCGAYSTKIVDPCEVISTRRKLTTKGKLLMCLPPPGDGVATVAKWTGLAHLAQLWEQITGSACGCGDRQQWLNRTWRAFIWQHFSEPG